MTPLHTAGFFGDDARIGLLLDHGATIDAQDVHGWTALHSAARLGRLDEAAYLVHRGADTRIRDIKGRTPLDVALDNRLLEHRWESLKQLLGVRQQASQEVVTQDQKQVQRPKLRLL